MQNTNNIITGFFAALVFPAIAMAISYLLRYNTDIVNRPALPYLLAIALNLIAMRILFRKGFDQTARGIMIANFVIMILVFLFKVHLR